MERALHRIRVTRGRGFTLIELLVVIAIIAILAALLFPVIGWSRYRAASLECLRARGQWVNCAILYATEKDGYYPNYARDNPYGGGGAWAIQQPADIETSIVLELEPYGVNPGWIICQMSSDEEKEGFAVRYAVARARTIAGRNPKWIATPYASYYVESGHLGVNWTWRQALIMSSVADHASTNAVITDYCRGSSKDYLVTPHITPNGTVKEISVGYADGHARLVPVRDLEKRYTQAWSPTWW